MKVTICDPCKGIENKVTETNQYLRVKGLRDLRLDVCQKHNDEAKILSMVDYVRLVYKCMGIDLTQSDEEIKQQFLVRG